MAGQGSGTNRQGRGMARAVMWQTSTHSHPSRHRRRRRGFPTVGRSNSGLRSGKAPPSLAGPTARSLPTLTIHSVATARASHSRAARAGTVLGVSCHCHPPRCRHVQRCAHQGRSPYHGASHPSGARAVRIHHGSAWPAPHQTTRVHARWQARERHAVPHPRQRCPTWLTNSRSPYQRAWPAGRHLAPWLIRTNGGQPRRPMRRNTQRPYSPRSVSTSTVQAGGRAGRKCRTKRHHSRRHAPRWCAGSIVQATGIAPPR